MHISVLRPSRLLRLAGGKSVNFLSLSMRAPKTATQQSIQSIPPLLALRRFPRSLARHRLFSTLLRKGVRREPSHLPRSLDRPRVEWVALALALADVELSLLILAAQHGHNDYFPPPSTTIRPWAKWMPALPGGALPPFGWARVGRRRSGNQSETEEPSFSGGFARRGRPCCYP